jgi:hypothetical protein
MDRSRESDRSPTRNVPASALRPDPSVERTEVGLHSCSLGDLLVGEELVDAALAGLPDADALVVPDLVSVLEHGLDGEHDDVVLGTSEHHLDQLGPHVLELHGQLAGRDEPSMHRAVDVVRQLTRLAPQTDDVVVSPALGTSIGSGLEARVGLHGVVELTDDAALGRGHEVLDLLLIEQLVERVADVKDDVLLSPRCLTERTRTARSWHRNSRIV